VTTSQAATAWFAPSRAAGPQAGSAPPYLPDLRLWYRWHHAHRTLPAVWQDSALADIAAALGVPAWQTVRPWSVETPGVEIQTQQSAGKRVISYHTTAGTLQERWSLGPDGDWWQMEYPVKTAGDLPAASALVAARTYHLKLDELALMQGESGEAGILAAELPMQPYSDILHTLLGWAEGLMLFKSEGRPRLVEMLAMLDEKLRILAGQMAALPGEIVLAPDNLDGQYISPRTFREHLAGSYRQTAEMLHAQGKRLVVHVGGPAGRLLPLLAEAGVDAVEGIAGPPQGDTALAEARAAAGPDLVLWGGIPQDLLLDVDAHGPEEFERAVRAAAVAARADGRTILGVADTVPVAADVGRLRALSGLIKG
jgi:hypothetical protein